MLNAIVTDGEALVQVSLVNRDMQQVETAAGAKAQIIFNLFGTTGSHALIQTV